jgi:hypothetical protein
MAPDPSFETCLPASARSRASPREISFLTSKKKTHTTNLKDFTGANAEEVCAPDTLRMPKNWQAVAKAAQIRSRQNDGQNAEVPRKKPKNKSRPSDKCDLAFAASGGLVWHLRLHLSDKPFPFYTCGKAFPRSSALATHGRTHTGDKPYRCVKCGKVFAQSNGLTVHPRVHSGDRPYSCDTCVATFATSGGLTGHLRGRIFGCTLYSFHKHKAVLARLPRRLRAEGQKAPFPVALEHLRHACPPTRCTSAVRPRDPRSGGRGAERACRVGVVELVAGALGSAVGGEESEAEGRSAQQPIRLTRLQRLPLRPTHPARAHAHAHRRPRRKACARTRAPLAPVRGAREGRGATVGRRGRLEHQGARLGVVQRRRQRHLPAARRARRAHRHGHPPAPAPRRA